VILPKVNRFVIEGYAVAIEYIGTEGPADFFGIGVVPVSPRPILLIESE
jgi:hypothetical protein